jgi:ketosteroid isomerase-like protein
MRTLLVVMSACFASTAVAQESPKELQEAFIAAVVAEDADALAALYTEDADSYDPSGAVQKGRGEIAATWQAFFDAYDGFSAALMQKGEHNLSKTSHAAWGLWTMAATVPGAPEETVWNGRFLDVSVKTPEGWRYIVDHASMLVSAPEPSE